MGSDGDDHLYIFQFAVRAFRTHVNPQVSFPPTTQCDWWVTEKRRFDPHTTLNQAYTPPTYSDGSLVLIIDAS